MEVKRMMPKSVFKIHIDEAIKALDAAEAFYNLAKHNPDHRKGLLEATRLCIQKSKAQIAMARIYKK
jgi:hypothetical protein